MSKGGGDKSGGWLESGLDWALGPADDSKSLKSDDDAVRFFTFY